MKQVKLKLFISNYLKLFFGVIFLVCSALFFAQENMKPVFQEGNNAYNEGDYNKAVHLYEQVLKMGQHSSILYYNLGNAHYRLNNVAESIFYYEKAKQLDPDNEDLIINSAFAQNMTIDAIEPLPISQLTRIEDFFLSLLSIEGWAYTSVLFAWLLAIFFAAYLWLNRSFWKRFFFTTSKEGDQSPQNGNPNQEKQQPPPPREGQLSPQQVQSLLEAMNNQEKDVQKKINAEKINATPVRRKKDW